VSDLVDDAFALAFALHQRSHRYDEARAVLDDVTALIPSYADGRARDPYYRGILAAETGDLRSALRDLREAELRASRLGLDRLERNARSAYLLALLRLGRASEANESLRSLENELVTTEGVTACERVEVAINVGWAALVANESGAREDASGPLERARAESECGDPYLRGTTLGNLALAYLRRGDTARATSYLADARRTVTEPSGAEQLFWLDVEARIALATWDARRALTLFDRACRLARASLLREAEYTCTLGRAEALEVQGKVADAITAYRAAEDILDERSVLVPLGEGRGSFVGQRGTSARLGVDLLVRTNRVPEALAMARTSRSRVLAGIERATRLEQLAPPERAKWEQAIGAYRRARAEIDTEAAGDWRLPQDKLATLAASRKVRDAELAASLEQAMSVIATSPPHVRAAQRESGALVLVLHPVRAGWLAIVADDSGVTSFPLGEVNVAADPAALASQILGPLAPRLARAKSLRVLPFGALRAIDLHALPFRGEPLVAKIPVEYPLDLRDALPPQPAAPSSLIVGVVGDPSGDLPAAREEARSVAVTIGKTGAHVQLLEGERATSAAVGDLLTRADGLHYAGHGLYAGQEGWESLLPLAAGGRLTIGDVLALHHAPRRVVLSGCETARSSREGPAEGLGLAQAFVIVGSDEVIAPVRPVRDALAAAMSRAFYEALPSSTNAAEALAHAQNVVRRDMPAEDWSSFRVLSP
jgi:CHAT domain-containing protein